MSAVESKSTFPPPPPWWRVYGNAETLASSSVDWRKPPPPPTNTAYLKFHEYQANDPTTVTLPPNITPLCTINDTTIDIGEVKVSEELRKMNATILKLYLELLQNLLTATKEHDSALKTNITLLSHHFINVNHLLNLLRKHQALQALTLMLDRQVKDKRERREKLRQHNLHARALLAQHGRVFATDSVSGGMGEVKVDGPNTSDGSPSTTLSSHAPTDSEQLYSLLTGWNE